MRRTGTTVIIEDVAFPIERLAEATLDLQRLLQQHGYPDAIIFGHALEGNLCRCTGYQNIVKAVKAAAAA